METTPQFKTLADGSIDIEHWLSSQKALTDIELVRKAATLTATLCAGQTTFYGQPLLAHALEMAEIILNLHLDMDTVAASILVNAVQYTNLSIDAIEQNINASTATLVQNEQQMNVLNTVFANIKKTRDQIQIDRLRKTFLSMAADIRVVLIKLAEQTCILRNIKNIHTEEKKRIAQETLDIYAPLANRLGIGQLKWELEDLSFHYINPDIYKMIVRFLNESRTDREERLHNVITRLQEEFSKRQIKAKMSGRAKHIYSIYLKMQKKHLDYKNIYDASAIRILVPTLEDCYNSLSIVHRLWEHIPEEFDDYIANPKPNGYQSIHTALIGFDQKNLEIQIRTFEMHHTAEHGIAAHWIYKENTPQQAGFETKVSFLRQLHLAIEDIEISGSLDFIKLLLEKGARRTALKKIGAQTYLPIELAAYNYRFDVLKLFAKLPADEDDHALCQFEPYKLMIIESCIEELKNYTSQIFNIHHSKEAKSLLEELKPIYEQLKEKAKVDFAGFLEKLRQAQNAFKNNPTIDRMLPHYARPSENKLRDEYNNIIDKYAKKLEMITLKKEDQLIENKEEKMSPKPEMNFKESIFIDDKNKPDNLEFKMQELSILSKSPLRKHSLLQSPKRSYSFEENPQENLMQRFVKK